MQAKDIPEPAVLAFLAELKVPATWYSMNGHPPENSVLRAMPPGTPEKVALAKMRALIRRGLVDGCPCGCGGAFTLTAAGRARLQAAAPP